MDKIIEFIKLLPQINVDMNGMIIFILSVGTVFQVFDITFNLPPFIRKIIKSPHARVRNALFELGYTDQQINEIVSGNKKIAGRLKKRGLKEEEILGSLFALMINYTYDLNAKRNYGNETLSESSYYIHTMEMVHNHDNLNKLAVIMTELINSGKCNPDFIIVPKSGNPFLAKRVAEEWGIPLLVLKGSKEESSLKITIDDDAEIFFKINFEGGHELLKNHSSRRKKLEGIVLDCNTSGGSQVYNALEMFNQVVDKGVLKADHIKDAFVLFRVDSGKNKFDDPILNVNGYKLHRFVDLDEKIKGRMAELAKERPEIDYMSDDNKNAIDNLISEISQDKKIWRSSSKKERPQK
jgi:hypothetical protein